jgi:hypothetical protein
MILTIQDSATPYLRQCSARLRAPLALMQAAGKALANRATEYPQRAAQSFEIAGFVWSQGNKDLGEPAARHYEVILTNLIHHLRTYYANRYPGKCSTNTPFLIATGCGDPGTSGYGLAVANAQLAVSGERGKYPEFAGNVKTMDTRGYWRNVAESPANQGCHCNRNAETFLLTDDALCPRDGLCTHRDPPGKRALRKMQRPNPDHLLE